MKKIFTTILLIIFSIASAKGSFVLLKMDIKASSFALVGCEELKPSLADSIKATDDYSDAKITHDDNPANGVVKNQTLFYTGYSDYISEGQMGYLGVSKDSGYGTLSMGFNWLNIDNIEGRDKPSVDPEYRFSGGYLTATSAYALEVVQGVNLGLSAKYLLEKNEFNTADGYAFSGGLSLDNLVENMRLSLAATNFGQMGKLENESTPLPSAIETGVGYRHDVDQFSIFTAVKSQYYTVQEEHETNLALEVTYLNRFSLRGGYSLNNEAMPFSVGVGAGINKFKFDYSFANFKDFGNIHTVGLSYYL